ncbi:MAG: hypothetical protein CVU39_02750 [Chloroflexi bacterium HGW-Chloroflexi-10]|nr:MAG: hypothetical protein CVU39_02750 [Chloroflexi bacterium HGW-Chloroflexi-10]
MISRSYFISRRKFLHGAFILGGAALTFPWLDVKAQTNGWSDTNRLGRVCVGKVDLRTKPSVNAPSVGVLYEDAIVVWLREVIGEVPGGRINARWVETPDGYIYAPSIQPVYNNPVVPVNDIPQTSLGKGMWCEICVPYVDLIQSNPPARSPSLKETLYPRLYYSQVIWVDDVKTGQDGELYFQVNERFGYGDIFWANAKAFRPITAEEIAPISPDVEEKRVVVDATRNRQYLSCYEGNNEVYYCQISSGAVWNASGEIVEEWGTPPGAHLIWRKAISMHMSGGSTGGGYDLSGVAWTTLFTGNGVAIHSTFWHNDFGTPKSHGCINVRPDDAKWIFRWTTPQVPIDPGDVQISGMGGTIIDVREA